MSKKKWVFFILSISITIIGKTIAPIEVISSDANTALFLLVSMVMLLITETLPAGLIAIIGIVAMPLLGLVGNLNDASKLFGGQLFFYMLACFAISTIMGKLPIARRLLYFFLTKFNKSTKGTIIALLLTTAVISTFVSDFPACLLMFIISKQYIQMFEDPEDRKRTQRSLMIGLIISAHIGGVIKPIGNSITILGSAYLAQSGHPITFLQWMAFGLPVAIATFPAAIFLLFKLFPPTQQSDEQREEFLMKVKAEIPEKVSIQEKITISILVVTFICWVANFNSMIVACLCGIALLFPGFNLMTWDEYNKGVSWYTILINNALLAVVTILQTTGVIDWLLGIFRSAIPETAGPTVILLTFGIFVSVILLASANGPVLMAVMGTAIIGLGIVIGIHPGVFVVGFACFASFSFILPIDAMNLIIYDGGKNFVAKDMPKAGIPTMLFATLIVALWMPLCGRIIGL